MRRCYSIILFVAVLCFAGSTYSQVPVWTKKQAKVFHEHGKERVDEYYWLNNPQDSTVIQHLRDENAYTESVMRHTEPLQKKIYDELISRIEQRYESLPREQHDYWYYVRYREGEQYPLYCRRKDGSTNAEEIYLDGPRLAHGHQIFMVRGSAPSPDGKLIAYGIDTTGGRRSTAYLKRFGEDNPLSEAIPNTSGSYAWTRDSKALLYVVNDNTVRPYRVMCHVIGTDPAADREVFVEKDSTMDVSLLLTRDNRFILLYIGDTEPREMRILPADHPEQAPRVIQPRAPKLVYDVEECEGDSLFILTNLHAKDFRLVKAPLAMPDSNSWVDVLPHRPGVLLEGAGVFKRFIVSQERSEALNQISILDRRTGTSHNVDFGEQVYVASWYPATDNDDLDSIRYVYTSPTTPRTEFLYRLLTRQRVKMKQDKVGGGYVDTLYETRREWAPAHDGARIPLSLVYKKSLLRKDGSNPLLLYAYGSYGFSMDPGFRRDIISLLDRGFVYCIAHIRGGEEMGREWYESGKMLKKKNTFLDFVSAARYLVAQKYTSPERLFANGGSAGGMLMGAVTNIAPELFRGIIAEVPWMDVVTDMFNPDLPLTTLEYGEWGNPNIEEQYNYMMTWSPYDNVRDAMYPAILATGGLNDTQVPYFSPAKWVARVRDHNKGKNPVLFKVNMGAGHAGESGRFESQKLTAFKFAFMLDLLGVRE